MSLLTAAINQINRYGYKGAAKLIPVTGKIEDQDQLTITPTFGAAIDLISYVGSFGPEQINNTTIFADDIKIMAAPDQDWDGTIADGSKIIVDGKTYDIIKSKTKKLKSVIAYVVIQVKG
mgnify:CR=1 FL=1